MSQIRNFMMCIKCFEFDTIQKQTKLRKIRFTWLSIEMNTQKWHIQAIHFNFSVQWIQFLISASSNNRLFVVVFLDPAPFILQYTHTYHHSTSQTKFFYRHQRQMVQFTAMVEKARAHFVQLNIAQKPFTVCETWP